MDTQGGNRLLRNWTATDGLPTIAASSSGLRGSTGALRDFLNFIRTKVDVGGSRDAADLVGAADADDGAGHGGIRQSPGDGDFARRRATALSDGSQRLDQSQVAGEQRLLEVGAVFTPV